MPSKQNIKNDGKRQRQRQWHVEPFQGTFDKNGQPILIPLTQEPMVMVGQPLILEDHVLEDDTDTVTDTVTSPDYKHKPFSAPTKTNTQEEEKVDFILTPFTGTMEELLLIQQQSTLSRAKRNEKDESSIQTEDILETTTMRGGESHHESCNEGRSAMPMPIPQHLECPSRGEENNGLKLCEPELMREKVTSQKVGNTSTSLLEDNQDDGTTRKDETYSYSKESSEENIKLALELQVETSSLKGNDHVEPSSSSSSSQENEQNVNEKNGYHLFSYNGTLEELIHSSRPMSGHFPSQQSSTTTGSGVTQEGIVVVVGLVFLLIAGGIGWQWKFRRIVRNKVMEIKSTTRTSRKKRRRRKKSNQHNDGMEMDSSACRESSMQSKRRKVHTNNNNVLEDTDIPFLSIESNVYESRSDPKRPQDFHNEMETIVPKDSMESESSEGGITSSSSNHHSLEIILDIPSTTITTQELFTTHVPTLAKEISRSGLNLQESLKIATQQVLEVQRRKAEDMRRSHLEERHQLEIRAGRARLELHKASSSTWSGMQLGKCISLGVSSHLLVKHWDVVKSLLREDEGRNLFHLFLDWILLEFCNYPDPGNENVMADSSWYITSVAYAYLPEWSYFPPTSYLLVLACLCRWLCYVTMIGFCHKIIEKFHCPSAHSILNLILLLTVALNTRIGKSLLSIIVQIFIFNVTVVAVMVWLPFSKSNLPERDEQMQHSVIEITQRTKIRLYVSSSSVSILIGVLPQLKQVTFQ